LGLAISNKIGDFRFPDIRVTGYRLQVSGCKGATLHIVSALHLERKDDFEKGMHNYITAHSTKNKQQEKRVFIFQNAPCNMQLATCK